MKEKNNSKEPLYHFRYKVETDKHWWNKTLKLTLSHYRWFINNMTLCFYLFNHFKFFGINLGLSNEGEGEFNFSFILFWCGFSININRMFFNRQTESWEREISFNIFRLDDCNLISWKLWVDPDEYKSNWKSKMININDVLFGRYDHNSIILGSQIATFPMIEDSYNGVMILKEITRNRKRFNYFFKQQFYAVDCHFGNFKDVDSTYIPNEYDVIEVLVRELEDETHHTIIDKVITSDDMILPQVFKTYTRDVHAIHKGSIKKVLEEKGIPVQGKGENSWDCGETATYSMYTPILDIKVEEYCPKHYIFRIAYGKIIESIMTERIKRGGFEWIPSGK